MAKKHALLIGTSEFNDHRLQPLVAPTKDINLLGNLLEDSQFCGFDSVKYCLNSSLEEVRSKIATLFSQRMKDDLLLLYYTGHGIVDLRGRLYFALPNSDPTAPAARSLDSNFIRQQMDDSNSSRQVIVLDCCHSGTFGENSSNLIGKDAGLVALNESTFDPRGHGRFVLSSSSAAERSFEKNGKSIFTHTLIDGVREGLAAPDKDEILLDDLHDYLCEAVSQKGAPMMPTYWADKDAEPIVFSRNPKKLIPLDSALIKSIEAKNHVTRIGAINVLEKIAITEEHQRKQAISLLKMRKDDGAERSDVSRAADQALQNIEQTLAPVKPELAQSPPTKTTLAPTKLFDTVDAEPDQPPSLNTKVEKTTSKLIPILGAIASAVILFFLLVSAGSNEVSFDFCLYGESLIECGYSPLFASYMLLLAFVHIGLLYKLGQNLTKGISASAIFFVVSFFLLFVFDSSYLLGFAATTPFTVGLIAMGCMLFAGYRSPKNIGLFCVISIAFSVFLELAFVVIEAYAFLVLIPVFSIILYIFYQRLCEITSNQPVN